MLRQEAIIRQIRDSLVDPGGEIERAGKAVDDAEAAVIAVESSADYLERLTAPDIISAHERHSNLLLLADTLSWVLGEPKQYDDQGWLESYLLSDPDTQGRAPEPSNN